MVARSGRGCRQLEDMVIAHDQPPVISNLVDYGQDIDESISKLEEMLQHQSNHSVRWLTIQLLEGNEYVKKHVESFIDASEIDELINQTSKKVLGNSDAKSLGQFIYKKRQVAISDILQNSSIKNEEKGIPLTNRIDAIVTNKWLGIPMFLLLMYFMFMLTFDWLGFPLSDALDRLISGPLTDGITNLLNAVSASEFIHSLILDGIVAGVGGVLVFVPQIFILFLFISILEDSGYMARVALVMDRLMEKVGLNGSLSFL